MFCDNLEGWGGEGDGRGIEEEGDIAILWLISVDAWQRLTHYCRSTVFQ